MVEPEDLRAACDRNLTLAFAALIPHVGFPTGGSKTFGEAVAIATGLTVPFYNPVIVTSAGSDADDIVAGIEWLESLGVVPSAQIRADLQERFDGVLRQLGFAPASWMDPGMALHPIPEPPPPLPSLRIERNGPGSFEDWHTALSSGANFRRAFPPTMLDDPAFRFVTGYMDDEPVAAAAAIITDDVVGIYAVGTAERARRKGFGRAMTWAAIHAGKEAGCSVAILQSSEMAVNVYREMGFVEVCRYVEYERPKPASNDA
jgi:GNAT superfamily N-acetyltransferase